MTVEGAVRPPGDKSITHRALILAGLIAGESEIEGVPASQDVRSTARVLRQLGAQVSPIRAGSVVRVRGRKWLSPRSTLNCGNSGTTARLVLGALAGFPLSARLTGDASLRRRPMRRVTEPLVAMGAEVTYEGEDGLPLRVRGGTLRPIAYRMPVASAQLKSALLLAGLVGGVDVSVSEPARSRDHTERLLRSLGAEIRVEGASIEFRGSPGLLAHLAPFGLALPGDISSAVFMIGVALLADEGELAILGVGVNPTRTRVLEALRRMGADVEIRSPRDRGGEPVADLVVRPGRLSGTLVPADEVPGLIDEIPILAVLASRADGETRFESVGELRHKESDRLALIARNLETLGSEARVEGDDLVVVGGVGRPKGIVETGGDHRIAMAFAVLGMVKGAGVRLSETASVAVSYPGFFADLARITRRD